MTKITIAHKDGHCAGWCDFRQGDVVDSQCAASWNVGHTQMPHETCPGPGTYVLVPLGEVARRGAALESDD